MAKREKVNQRLLNELESVRDAIGNVYLLKIFDIILELIKNDKNIPKTRKKKMIFHLSNLFKKIEKEIL